MMGAEAMAAVFSAREIAEAVGGRIVRGDGAARAAGVSADTRTLKEGELFFALKGPNFDGADFLARAMEKGAAGVVAEAGAAFPAGGGFAIEAPDALRALGDLARRHRGRFDIPVAGVTGSNGKTTTKEMTAAVLSARGETRKSRGNLNNLVGLPLEVFRLGEAHASAVFEMGMSAAGEIRRLAEVARPGVAVITNIGPAHVGELGGMKAVRDAKGEILEALPAEGAAVLSNEDAHSRALAARREAAGGRVIRFGFSAESDFWAEDVRLDARGARFTLRRIGGGREVRLRALGRHNVLNALAAAGCASAMGCSLEETAEGLSRAELPDMRLRARALRGRTGVRLLDDSYNANPESVFRALETADALRGGGRLVAILGDMLELGEIAESAHRDAGRKAAGCGAALFAGVGPLMRLAVEEARRAGMDDSRSMGFDAPEEAASAVAGMLLPGDWVLVKGSRSMRMERAIEGLEA